MLRKAISTNIKTRDIMKLKNIKAIAKAKGIKVDDLKKPELVQAIQRAEGNFECFRFV